MALTHEGDKLKGLVVRVGDIPEDSGALAGAREIARTTGENVVITDAFALQRHAEEGLPTKTEVPPVRQSQS